MDDYFGQAAAPPSPALPAPTAWPPPAGPYPPPAWGQPGYVAPPAGTSSGVKVLIAIAAGLGAFVVIGVLAAIAIPVFLNQRSVVSTPDVVLGFPRMTDAASRAEAERFLAMPIPGRKVAASYGRDGEPVVVFGGASHSMSRGEGQDFFQGAERTYTQSASFLRFVDVDPGARGGEMRCAGMSTDRGPATLCLFAGSHAYGTITVYGADGQALAVQVRNEVERP
ncbi:MAG TPA: hypothetical protein VM097_07345 [Mycobacteriales bacterium]|nr:hypothetical protein [Mycobacteriales bacterium]